jgi:hypothetical protein
MAFDRDGTEVAHLSTGFEAALTADGAADALREGLAYTLRIPIRQAGPYQVRFAVHDRQSDKLGTAGEFIEIADVPHGGFALSGIVLRGEDDKNPSASGQMAISPSEAIRVYAPGTELRYACDVYNAAGPVQLALTVWRGQQRVLAAPPVTLTPPPGADKVFAASGAFKLGAGLPPGDYVLQLAAQTADPSKKGAVKRALQQIDFQVK